MLNKSLARSISLLLLLFFSINAHCVESIDDRLSQLLRSKDYLLLDAELNFLVKKYQEDFKGERELDIALDSFYRADPLLQTFYDEWINKQSNSAVAYLARGIYFTKMGWSSRGSKYISETKKEQVDGMKFYFEKAINDFEKAKILNKNLVHIYCYEMEIYMALGSKAKIAPLKELALKINPYSLTARTYYLSSLLPRWGGSVIEMENEISLAKPFYTKNKKLEILNGRVFSELGDQELLKGNYQDSLNYYNQAVKSGDYWFYYGMRGEAYTNLNNMPMAISDLENAVKLRPNYPHANALLGFNYAKKQDLRTAIYYLSRALSAEPNDSFSLDLRGVCNMNMGNYQDALDDFSKALELNPASMTYMQHRDLAKEAIRSMKFN
ncbi:tetratricopeptide repeat protein [Cellvibrio sp.]|uniref:tetratricopeptide repeat protein n=1 Tax=Cellvibrio sp. TaxID=1965322 RepID=UPI00396483AA